MTLLLIFDELLKGRLLQATFTTIITISKS